MADPIALTLPCEALSAPIARRELEPFRELLGATRFGDLQLLVSELVAEAVGALWGAGTSKLTVRAERRGDCVRASVEGGPQAFLVPSTRPEPAEPGWAVYLVGRLTDSWGVRKERRTATVWLELRPGPDA